MVMTEEQRLQAILHMEGMPQELPLLSEERPDLFDVLDTSIEPQNDIESAMFAHGLDSMTAVDKFIEVQEREPESFAKLTH